MQEMHYKGIEISKYQDPCLTCENYGKEKECCCEKWEKWEETRMTCVFEEDFT